MQDPGTSNAAPAMTMAFNFFSNPDHIAELNRPFMLSTNPSSANLPDAGPAFADMLEDLLGEDIQLLAEQQPSLGDTLGIKVEPVQPAFFSEPLPLNSGQVPQMMQQPPSGPLQPANAAQQAIETSAGQCAVPVVVQGNGHVNGHAHHHARHQQASGEWGSNDSFARSSYSSSAISAGTPTHGPHALPPSAAASRLPTQQQQSGPGAHLGMPSGPAVTDAGGRGRPRRARRGGGEAGTAAIVATTAAEARLADKAQRRAAVQKRYREKKEGTLSQLEAEAQEKALAVAALEAQNSLLARKQTLLEELVQCRDEQLVVLARARGMCRAPEPLAVTAGCIKQESPAHPAVGGCFASMDWAAPVTQTHPDTLQAIKCMTVEEFITSWKAFMSQASALLAEQFATSHNSNTDAGAKLTDCVREAGLQLRAVIQLNCPVLFTVMQLHLDTRVAGAPPDSHWLNVIKTIQLTPQQCEEATAMYQVFSDLMEKVLEERRMLKQALGSSPSVPFTANPMADGGKCCADEMSYVEQLLLSLHKERSTRCLLCCFFFGKLMTPVQLAKAAVASHPYFPDPLSISRVLAQLSALSSVAIH